MLFRSHRLHAFEDSNGSLWKQRGSRRARRLALLGRMFFQHRRRIRSVRRTRDLLNSSPFLKLVRGGATATLFSDSGISWNLEQEGTRRPGLTVPSLPPFTFANTSVPTNEWTHLTIVNLSTRGLSVALLSGSVQQRSSRVSGRRGGNPAEETSAD